MKRVLVLYVVTFLISPEFVGLVKPNLSAHSDIKIEDGDADIQKEVQVRLPSSTHHLFR